MDLIGEFLADSFFLHLQIIVRLQIEPELWRYAEVLAQPQSSVSEIARCPCTISLIRLAGTLMSLASLYWLMHIGVRKSSIRISPGCIGDIFFVFIISLDRLQYYRLHFLYTSQTKRPHMTAEQLRFASDHAEGVMANLVAHFGY